jgi:hypothetical protein
MTTFHTTPWATIALAITKARKRADAVILKNRQAELGQRPSKRYLRKIRDPEAYQRVVEGNATARKLHPEINLSAKKPHSILSAHKFSRAKVTLPKVNLPD